MAPHTGPRRLKRIVKGVLERLLQRLEEFFGGGDRGSEQPRTWRAPREGGLTSQTHLMVPLRDGLTLGHSTQENWARIPLAHYLSLFPEP